MVFDMHSHVQSPWDRQLRDMNEAGIDRAVLFLTRPHPERAGSLDELKEELSILGRATGGSLGEAESFEGPYRELEAAAALSKGRLIPFGSLPLSLPPKAIEEWVEDRIIKKGMRGIGELVPKPGRFQSLEPVLAAAEAYPGLPVAVHGFHPTSREDLEVLAAVARDHPRVPVIIGQMGGLEWIACIELARALPNLWLDVATPMVAFGPRFAARSIPDRCLFGTNAPYGNPLSLRILLEQTIRDRAELEALLTDNPQRLLGMFR